MMILPNEVEELDSIIQNVFKKLDIRVEPATPCVTRIRIHHRQDTVEERCRGQQLAERPSALREG